MDFNGTWARKIRSALDPVLAHLTFKVLGRVCTKSVLGEAWLRRFLHLVSDVRSEELTLWRTLLVAEQAFDSASGTQIADHSATLPFLAFLNLMFGAANSSSPTKGFGKRRSRVMA